MSFTMILALDRNNLIGSSSSHNGLAWHYDEDLAFYKENTVNKINVMGHKTYKAIGRALPNRTSVVLSRNVDLVLDDAIVINDIADVFKLEGEVVIIGGVEIFRLLFDCVDQILLTRIDASHVGDIYYDDLDLSSFKKVDQYYLNNKILCFEKWERF